MSSENSLLIRSAIVVTNGLTRAVDGWEAPETGVMVGSVVGSIGLVEIANGKTISGLVGLLLSAVLLACDVPELRNQGNIANNRFLKGVKNNV